MHLGMYLGEAVVPCALVCSPQCATVCMGCAAMGHRGTEAACALLDILASTVTKVSSAAGGRRFSVA